MAVPRRKARAARRLPARLRPFFWDHDFGRLRWERDVDLITGRLLADGDWEAVCWLRRRLGDAALRAWLERRQGAGLSPRQLRFWELILHLPRRTVSRWLAAPGRQVWDRRRHE
jgi:hypothetical protein